MQLSAFDLVPQAGIIHEIDVQDLLPLILQVVPGQYTGICLPDHRHVIIIEWLLS